MTECEITVLAYKLAILELTYTIDWPQVALAACGIAFAIGFSVLWYIALRR